MRSLAKAKRKLKEFYRKDASSKQGLAHLKGDEPQSSPVIGTPSPDPPLLSSQDGNVAREATHTASTPTPISSSTPDATEVLIGSQNESAQSQAQTEPASEPANVVEPAAQDDNKPLDSETTMVPGDVYWNAAMARLESREKRIFQELPLPGSDKVSDEVSPDNNNSAVEDGIARPAAYLPEDLTPFALALLASEKTNRLDDQAWKFRFRNRDIILRDLANKIVLWLGKFKEIGDVAASFDPVHAALPWAAIRFLLQAATAEQELAGHMLIGVEKASYLLARCQVYRKLYLDRQTKQCSRSTAQLKETLICLYSKILSLMAHLVTLTNRSMARRALHAMLNPSGLSEWISALEELEQRIEADASNCERESRSSMDETWRERYDAMRRLLSQHILFSEQERTKFLDECKADERLKILQWISDIPYEADHYNARLNRTKGTGEWLLADPVYKDWRTTSASICLWLHGMVGAGKTKLSTKVVDDLSALNASQASGECLAYFYCDRNREKHKDPVCILRSFVRQLSASQSDNTIVKCVYDKYTQMKQKGFASELNQEDCAILLLSLVNIFPQTTFVALPIFVSW